MGNTDNVIQMDFRQAKRKAGASMIHVELGPDKPPSLIVVQPNEKPGVFIEAPNETVALNLFKAALKQLRDREGQS